MLRARVRVQLGPAPAQAGRRGNALGHSKKWYGLFAVIRARKRIGREHDVAQREYVVALADRSGETFIVPSLEDGIVVATPDVDSDPLTAMTLSVDVCRDATREQVERSVADDGSREGDAFVERQRRLCAETQPLLGRGQAGLRHPAGFGECAAWHWPLGAVCAAGSKCAGCVAEALGRCIGAGDPHVFHLECRAFPLQVWESRSCIHANAVFGSPPP